jgi:hypothetical protein
MTPISQRLESPTIPGRFTVQRAHLQVGEISQAAEALREALETADVDPLAATEAQELREISLEAPLEAQKSQPSKWGLKAMYARLLALSGAVEAGHTLYKPISRLAHAIGNFLEIGGS